MNSTRKEKAIIDVKRPVISIEEIKFESICMDEAGVQPEKCCCFLTDEASDAIDYEEGIEGITAIFRFRDYGKKAGPKYVSFNGPARFTGNFHGEIVNFISSLSPAIAFPATEDKEGRFSVSVPFFIRKVDYESEDILEDMKSGVFLFTFNDITIDNQFVERRFDSILGLLSKSKTKCIDCGTLHFNPTKNVGHSGTDVEIPQVID